MSGRYSYACARRDVIKEERERLSELLESFEDQEQEDRRRAILQMLGKMTFQNTYDASRGLHRTSCDGQCLSLVDSDGRLLNEQFNPRSPHDLEAIPDNAMTIVDDPGSPYDGYSLSTYRAICDYIKDRRQQKKYELLAENQARPTEERESESNITRRAHQWKLSPWPPQVPEGSKNWKAVEGEGEG